MKYEAGITEITYPFAPRWTGIIVEADSPEQAEELFSAQGFYRNLIIQEIKESTPSEKLQAELEPLPGSYPGKFHVG